MKIERIQILDFKGIKDISLSLDSANLLIGGNNSGKSSVIQGIHFAISALRSARLHGKGANQPATTLGVNQFSFLPTNEIMRINHRKMMTQDDGPWFDFYFKNDAGEEKMFRVAFYRGKNANVSIRYDQNSPFFAQASDPKSPFLCSYPAWRVFRWPRSGAQTL